MSVGVQSGTTTLVLSYDAPLVSSALALNVPTTGKVGVSVTGVLFGVVDYSPGARVGGSACGHAAWESDSGLRCLGLEGIGSVSRLVVSVGEQLGSVSEAVSYDDVAVSSLVHANAPVTGDTESTLFGARFGVDD